MPAPVLEDCLKGTTAMRTTTFRSITRNPWWCFWGLLAGSFISVTCSSGSDSGGGTAGGTSGTGPATADCRDYMTEGTIQGPMPDDSMGIATATANFDPSTNTYTGSMVAPGVIMTDVRTYASAADFVDEVKIVGRDLCTSEIYSGGYIATDTYIYDGQRRVIGMQVQEPVDTGEGAYAWTYTAWDDQGRPTTGTLDVPQSGCMGMPVTLEYDDQARKKTTVITPAAGQGSGCRSQTAVSDTWKVYDANGNVVEELHSGSDASSVKTTVTKTGRVCK